VGRHRNWNWGRGEGPDVPGPGKKRVRERRKRKRQRKAERAEKRKMAIHMSKTHDRSLTREEWKELLDKRPLIGELEAMSEDPDLVHLWTEIDKLQNRLINGQTLSGRSSIWFEKVKTFRLRLEEEPHRLSKDDEYLFTVAWKLVRHRFRGYSEKRHRDPVLAIMGNWRKKGWVPKQSVKIIRKAFGKLVKELQDPAFKEKDLISYVVRWPRTGERLGLIAGPPVLSGYHGEARIYYPVIELQNKGEIVQLSADQITLKRAFPVQEDEQEE